MTRVVLLLTSLAAGAALAGLGCSSKPKACAVGSESCDCTAGGACDPGLECRSMLCVDPQHGLGSAGTGARTTGAAGVTGSGGVGSGTGGGGGTAVVGAPVCSFPVAAGKPTEKQDPTGQSKDSLQAEFAGGRLTKLDGNTCVPDTSGVKATGDWGSYACMDAYSCGGCLVFLLDENPQAPGPWTLLGAYAATNGANPGCAQYSGVYSICVPNCTMAVDGGTVTKVCGDDGCSGSCGSCGLSPHCCNKGSCAVDHCAECLDACSGLPGCCTGTGCQCEGSCGTPWCAP